MNKSNPLVTNPQEAKAHIAVGVIKRIVLTSKEGPEEGGGGHQGFMGGQSGKDPLLVQVNDLYSPESRGLRVEVGLLFWDVDNPGGAAPRFSCSGRLKADSPIVKVACGPTACIVPFNPDLSADYCRMLLSLEDINTIWAALSDVCSKMDRAAALSSIPQLASTVASNVTGEVHLEYTVCTNADMLQR